MTNEKDVELGLEAANEALALSNAEHQAFTYSASHDLKEPLRAVEAFSRILLDEYSDDLDEDGQDYLRRISAASVRMKDMINDLVTISRIGTSEADPQPVDVRELVATIADDMRPSMLQRNASVAVAAHLPIVFADVKRATQVFSNLISNAIKFNKSDAPHVEIGAEVNAAGETEFFVRDNGIGIAPDAHENVFGIFQRLHRRDEFEGSGAGLAIVKRALTAIGGRIRVESAVGKGATFLFTLPVVSEQALPAAAQEAA